jgi:2,3-bisphosphoglycerate-independent phosphoglycerate mutase
MPSKVLLLLIDGVGDVTIPALGNRTPLEVAHTPFLDALAGEPAAAAVSGPPRCQLLRR